MSVDVTPILIRMHADDNVAIVANDGGLGAGTQIPNGPTLLDKLPQGHKLALENIAAGSPVRRYGVIIGIAKSDIAAGRWVHERLLDMPAARSFDGLPMATVKAPPQAPLDGYSFMGYRNADGSAGTRNLLAITTTVQCVAGVVGLAVQRITAELLPQFPNVDGVVGLEHSYGCGVAIDAPGAEIPIRTLRHISLNPNFGGEVMVVSLGCEKLPPERLMPPGSIPINDQRGETLDTVRLQDDAHIGLTDMVDHILTQARVHLTRLNARKREPVPASALVVGVQCGGSDAFSGATANPAVGYCADLLVRVGATIMFSENTEVRDGVDQLTSRAATPEIAEAIIRELDWYDRYLARGQADRSRTRRPATRPVACPISSKRQWARSSKAAARPSPMCCHPAKNCAKTNAAWSSPPPPASDFICGTLQLAAGMNLHVFTTGRGTPYGLAACPVIKVATRTDLARRWHDLMDLNAGLIADGQATIEDTGWAMFKLLLDTASGRKTWAEQHRLHNALVLFNPAPVT